MLEHHAELVAPQPDQLLRAGQQEILAVEQYLAGGRLDQAGKAAHQRRLAGAGQAHDDETLAGEDGEFDVGHGGDQSRAGDGG